MTRKQQTSTDSDQHNAGYCEMCCQDYTDLSEHLISPGHLKLATDHTQFAALDNLIKETFHNNTNGDMCPTLLTVNTNNRRVLRSSKSPAGNVDCSIMGNKHTNSDKQLDQRQSSPAPLSPSISNSNSQLSHTNMTNNSSNNITNGHVTRSTTAVHRQQSLNNSSTMPVDNQPNDVSNWKKLSSQPPPLQEVQCNGVSVNHCHLTRLSVKTESLQFQQQQQQQQQQNLSPTGSDHNSHHLRSKKQLWLPTNLLGTTAEDDGNPIRIKNEAKMASPKNKRRKLRKKRLSVEEKLIEDNKSYYKVEVLNSKLRSTGYYMTQRELELNRLKANDSSVTDGTNNAITSDKLQSKTEDKEPVVVRFKKVRKSELSLLSDEAESFMFGEPIRKDNEDESSTETEDNSTTNDNENSCSNSSSSVTVSGAVNSNKKEIKKEEIIDESSMGSCCSSSQSNSTTKRKRRTHAEMFIHDNLDYYKFDIQGSRLRLHSGLLQPVVTTVKIDYNNEDDRDQNQVESDKKCKDQNQMENDKKCKDQNQVESDKKCKDQNQVESDKKCKDQNQVESDKKCKDQNQVESDKKCKDQNQVESEKKCKEQNQVESDKKCKIEDDVDDKSKVATDLIRIKKEDDKIEDNEEMSAEQLSFSFENVPELEPWYQTFKRQDECKEIYHPIYSGYPKIRLPYEYPSFEKQKLLWAVNKLFPFRKKRRRFSKNADDKPRKSPRCHASTLAILSSLKYRRKKDTPDKLKHLMDTPKKPAPAAPTPPPPSIPSVQNQPQPLLSQTSQLLNEDESRSSIDISLLPDSMANKICEIKITPELNMRDVSDSIDSLFHQLYSDNLENDKYIHLIKLLSRALDSFDEDSTMPSTSSSSHCKGKQKTSKSNPKINNNHSNSSSDKNIISDIIDTDLCLDVDPNIITEMEDMTTTLISGPEIDMSVLFDNYKHCNSMERADYEHLHPRAIDALRACAATDGSCNSSDCGGSSTCELLGFTEDGRMLSKRRKRKKRNMTGWPKDKPRKLIVKNKDDVSNKCEVNSSSTLNDDCNNIKFDSDNINDTVLPTTVTDGDKVTDDCSDVGKSTTNYQLVIGNDHTSEQSVCAKNKFPKLKVTRSLSRTGSVDSSGPLSDCSMCVVQLGSRQLRGHSNSVDIPSVVIKTSPIKRRASSPEKRSPGRGRRKRNSVTRWSPWANRRDSFPPNSHSLCFVYLIGSPQDAVVKNFF
ncbi:uncharacterized protein LOC142333664 isoform X2 [Lycorma delicatula]